MIKNMLMELENFINCVNTDFQSDCLLLGVQSKIYQPLMKREMCGECMVNFIKAGEYEFVDEAEILILSFFNVLFKYYLLS